ncbi:MAG: ABC transporter permease [Candidatus Caldarchaeum sp.]|nr:ABC transporter permease [Candidatus Caldarchaeum sp.]MDW8359926.1 ABC transporter permease [Candidatus Caldarchaeum sp.]
MRLKPLLRYKSSLVGVGILCFLIILSVYTVATLPFEEAARLWRAGELTWLDNPRNALPAWVNFFSPTKLPETLILNTQKPGPDVIKVSVRAGENIKISRVEMNFRYGFDDFPSEINLFFTSTYRTSPPQLTISWTKPDGTQIPLRRMTIAREDRFYISSDTVLSTELNQLMENRLGRKPAYTVPTSTILFGPFDETLLNPESVKVVKGDYRLSVEGLLFEPEADFDVKLVVYGKVYGWAGTDHLRRDIGIALLWGTPIALLFGVSAAVSIALIQMTIGAVSAWFRGGVDTVMQRITEVFLVLPFLPVLIMVSTLYKVNIWVILLIVVFLSSFGPGVKNYRALFLQLRESPYIEAARSYGAGDLRIVVIHLIPRVLPTMIPSVVLSAADFVFLEAALAILGIGDPITPTWGKVIQDAFYFGALFKGHYYWVLIPSALLAATSISFALIGFALDKIFNPRLKEV